MASMEIAAHTDPRGATVASIVVGTERIHAKPGLDVWSVELDRSRTTVDVLYGVLSDDERQRADAFRFQLHRDRFTACRATLRMLLAQHLDQQPSQVHLRGNAFGKPFIDDPQSPIRFNVSHSDGCALIAIASDRREVGVDLEKMTPLADFASLAATVFSRAELAEFHAVNPAERVQAFYNGWTRKEAYVKALGAGLQQPLQSFDVTLRPEAPARLVRAECDPHAADRWTLEALRVRTGFAAAICYEPSRRQSVRHEAGRGQ